MSQFAAHLGNNSRRNAVAESRFRIVRLREKLGSRAGLISNSVAGGQREVDVFAVASILIGINQQALWKLYFQDECIACIHS